MSDRTYNNIKKALDSYDDLRGLSARKLAELSYTSPSTISRFVKQTGYNDFIEMKMSLLRDRQVEASQSSIFEDWNSMFNIAFENLDINDIALIKENREKKIYIACNRVYSLITRQFVDSLRLNNINCIMITQEEFYNIDVCDECIILAIGNLEKKIYISGIVYYEIKFEADMSNAEHEDINIINLVKPHIIKLKTYHYTFRVACMHVYLSMMVDSLNN